MQEQTDAQEARFTELQRGRARESAEMTSILRASDIQRLLQRGRARESAEME